MVVGLGGNNGTTMVAGIIANRECVLTLFDADAADRVFRKIGWNTKEGPREPNYYGSMTQCSTVRLSGLLAWWITD